MGISSMGSEWSFYIYVYIYIYIIYILYIYIYLYYIYNHWNMDYGALFDYIYRILQKTVEKTVKMLWELQLSFRISSY